LAVGVGVGVGVALEAGRGLAATAVVGASGPVEPRAGATLDLVPAFGSDETVRPDGTIEP
jgi:hypothetical protein